MLENYLLRLLFKREFYYNLINLIRLYRYYILYLCWIFLLVNIYILKNLINTLCAANGIFTNEIHDEKENKNN